MKATDVAEFSKVVISAIFHEVPLIGRALKAKPAEFDYFFKWSKIFEAKPGEVVIRRVCVLFL